MIETTVENHMKKRVLIVDDIRTDLHYVGKLVSSFGYEAILADSANSALEMIDNDTDIVIADGIMPEMDGFDLVKTIRNDISISHIPVIMVTSLTGKSDRLKAVEAGINDYISKPVDKVELKVRINSMLKMKDAQDRVRQYQKDLEKLVEKKTKDLSSTLNKLQAVLNGMNDCVVTLDKHSNIIEVNQAFQKVSGKNVGELKGCCFETLLDGEHQIKSLNTLLDETHPLREKEIEFSQWGGRIYSVLATHMKNEGHILVMRDITEKKQADVQRARFLSILSHELRTPLNGIKGFSEVMMSEPDGLSDEYKEYMGMVHECGCQLESIVEELLNFVQLYSGLEEPEESDINLEAVVNEVLVSMEEKYPDHTTVFTLTVEGPPPVIHAKSEHLSEIIYQIVDNSVKFNRDDGKTDIVLCSDDETVRFTCRDDGKGIPGEVVDKVFDSFFQVESYITRSQEGLGLGLTIAKKMVEMYHGSIGIESREGTGTVVAITFPKPRA